MKNINKIRKICVTAIVLIFMINTSISAVSALYFNFNTIKSIEGRFLNLNEKINSFGEPLDDVWNVTLEFNEPGGVYDDAFFGEKTDASDGVDIYDVLKLPYSFTPYIRAWFASGLPSPYDQLWHEYKHYPGTSKQWNLTVQWVPTDYTTPTTVTISWNPSEVDNSEYITVKLYSSTGVQLKNMLTESSYSFSCPANTPQIFYIKCEANNNAPNSPNTPNPINDTNHVDLNADLSWICTDPDGDPLTYDIYFGTNSNPPLVQNNQSSNSYDPGTMNYSNTYYWKIVAWDNQSSSTSSPIWHFSTNYAPNVPANPSPINNSNHIDINANLGWTCTDPDGDPLTYDIYFGTNSNPPLIQSNWPTNSYDLGIMNYGTTYYWKIIAKDNYSVTRSSPIWHFTTNYAPNTPYNPDPVNQATGVNINADLNWTCIDPDGDPLTYDIYFGTNSNPPLIQSNWPTNSYDPGTMNYGTTYYWKIIAKDNYGVTTSSPIWYFTTNYAPNPPNNPNPTNGSNHIDINANLGWTCTDPDGDPLTYDIYFGTNSNPPLVQNNQSSNSYDPGKMNYSTLYYWKIVAKDNYGVATSSVIWHFTTKPNSPPNVPSNPNPPNNAIDIDTNADLSWTCTDPDGDPLTYDIYFGTNSNPPLVQNNQSSNSYDPGTMNNYTTYYWKIVAWDDQVAYTSGPVWSFTTAQNSAPNIPSDPYPPNNATDIDLNADLSWICTDPDGDPLSYDIYFGNSSNPSLVQSNWSETTYDPGILDANTTYYWMIIAWDIVGNSASGPIWNFTTGQQMNENPYEPYNPSPEDGATNVDVNTNLRWNGGDPDGDPVTYDIYFSISYPPQQVASNHTSNVYDPGTLDFETTYYWKIVAWDNHSARTSGPIWSFTTSNQINRPPIRPVIESILGILVPNRPYEYNFTSNDPDNDDVFFYVDWGDGTFEDWVGPYFSGETITINHTWPAKTMIYQIKTKAKDTYGSESDWGTFLVFVLSPRGSNSSIIIRIIQRIPILQRLLMIIPLINKLIKK